MSQTVITDPSQLRVKIFADGADRAGIAELYAIPWVRGFTTNPTLMRQAGVADYETFAREILELVPDRPISFEVFSDEPREMEEQARAISSWGENVFVKIPVTDTRGRPSADVARRLAASGVKLNVTALMTAEQVATVAGWLADAPACFVSLFAGRVADTGRDPVPIMTAALDVLRPHPHLELIWASPREVLNIIQADAIGCHVITVTHDLLRKLSSLGRDLDEFSLATVKMFYDDGQAARYALRHAGSPASLTVTGSAGPS
jgi:transaldolase